MAACIGRSSVHAATRQGRAEGATTGPSIAAPHAESRCKPNPWWLDTSIPMDMPLAIASWLTETELCNLSQVSKASLAFGRDDRLWKNIYLRRFGDLRPAFAVPPLPPTAPKSSRLDPPSTPVKQSSASSGVSNPGSAISIASAAAPVSTWTAATATSRSIPSTGSGNPRNASVTAGSAGLRSVSAHAGELAAYQTAATTSQFHAAPAPLKHGARSISAPSGLSGLELTCEPPQMRGGPGGFSWFEHARRRQLSPLSGDVVQVLWDGAFNLVEGESVRSYGGRAWWDASVVRREGGNYLVHYLRWSAAVWDEWVADCRVRRPPPNHKVARRWQRRSPADEAARRRHHNKRRRRSYPAPQSQPTANSHTADGADAGRRSITTEPVDGAAATASALRHPRVSHLASAAGLARHNGDRRTTRGVIPETGDDSSGIDSDGTDTDTEEPAAGRVALEAAVRSASGLMRVHSRHLRGHTGVSHSSSMRSARVLSSLPPSLSRAVSMPSRAAHSASLRRFGALPHLIPGSQRSTAGGQGDLSNGGLLLMDEHEFPSQEELQGSWPWLRRGDVDFMRAPCVADVEQLVAAALRAETSRDCASLNELRLGDVVEFRCVSTPGRAPWLETTVEAIVSMDWGRMAVCPSVEATVTELLVLWATLYNCSQQPEPSRAAGWVGSVAASAPLDLPASTVRLPLLSAPLTASSARPLPAPAPHTPDASGRSWSASTATNLAATPVPSGGVDPSRAVAAAIRAALAPPSASQRLETTLPATSGGVSAASASDHTITAASGALELAGLSAAVSAAMSRLMRAPMTEYERQDIAFGSIGYRVGREVLDEENRLVSRHRLRLVKRADPDAEAGQTERRRAHRLGGSGCAVM